MITISLLIILTGLSLFFLGFGLTVLLIPPKLKSYAFWLTPWVSIIYTTFFLVIFGLFGVSVRYASPFIILSLTVLNLYVVFKTHRRLRFFQKRDFLLIAFVIFSVLFNLSPLLMRNQFATVISMGNNDIHAYVVTADYLITHSLSEGLHSQITGPVHTLLQFGYRWGSPMITAFFLNLIYMQGFQYLSIFQAVIFALLLPLVYILIKILHKSSSNLTPILGLMFVAFNVNLLYMLYHNFLGQILFQGLALFVTLLLFSYFESEATMTKGINRYDLIIAATFSVIFFSYHEGAVLIAFPLGLFLILRHLVKKKNTSAYLWASAKIALLTSVTSSQSIIHAVKFMLFYRINEFTEPIGWQQFRSHVPYANPFEMMGFYSIHSFAPLPFWSGFILSMLIVCVIGVGFFRSRQRILSGGFILLYIVFLLFALSRHQFWIFNRMVTYSVPFFSLLFAIGIAELIKITRGAYTIIIVCIGLLLFSAMKLNARYRGEHLTVDASLISLKKLAYHQKVSEPIYTEQVLNPLLPAWKELWAEYFLSPQKQIITTFTAKREHISIPSDNGLFLISKSSSYYIPPHVLFKEVLWENEHYILGRLCGSDECLLTRDEDLSSIDFGTSMYEDSLLVSGWSVSEKGNRWTNSLEATVRLVTKDTHFSHIYLEVFALKQPQKMTVYFDDHLLATQKPSTHWQTYSFPIKNPKKGLHIVKFTFSHIYQPSQLGASQDDRTLAANFKIIKIK